MSRSYRNEAGDYRNQNYVNSVLQYWNYFKKKFKTEVSGRKGRYQTEPFYPPLPFPLPAS